MKKFILLSLVAFFAINLLSAEKEIFVDLEKININMDKLLFSGLSSLQLAPDGFVFVLSRGRQNNLVAKFDRQGNITSVYDKPGNGPGEIRSASNVVATDKAIFVCEFNSPYVHEFNMRLEFIKDHRIKKAGKLFILGDKYAGIWGPNYLGKEGERIDTLALYDLKDFNFVKTVFQVKEVPALYHFWGYICQASQNTFAGIYPTKYQIRIFNEDMTFEKNLLAEPPGHIIKYTPYKGSVHVVDNNIVEWGESWSVLHSIYFVDDKYILKYMLKKEHCIDIIDSSGKVLYPNYKEKKRFHIVFSEDQKYIWRLKVEEGDESNKYTLVKQKLVL